MLWHCWQSSCFQHPKAGGLNPIVRQFYGKLIHREVIKRREKIGTGNFRVQPVANAWLYQNTLVILINLRLNKHFNTI